MHTLQGLLTALAGDPADDTGWLALADCLAEQGADDRAELVRLQRALRLDPEGPDVGVNEERLRHLWSAGVDPCLPMLHGPFGLDFTLVPPGSFWMGARQDEPWHDPDEEPRHRVTLTRGFYLSTTQITQSAWQALMGENPSHARGRDRPVEQVSWNDACDFCKVLGARLGRTCRLPTEAEWEYACRAGTLTMYCSGDRVEDLQRVGWCSFSGEWDASGGTRDVGSLRPNPLGIHDMHGNVWEWCADWLHRQTYQRQDAIDPIGPRRGSTRAVRGGSWRGGPWFCRSAERRGIDPGVADVNIGFRVALDVE